METPHPFNPSTLDVENEDDEAIDEELSVHNPTALALPNLTDTDTFFKNAIPYLAKQYLVLHENNKVYVMAMGIGMALDPNYDDDDEFLPLIDYQREPYKSTNMLKKFYQPSLLITRKEVSRRARFLIEYKDTPPQPNNWSQPFVTNWLHEHAVVGDDAIFIRQKYEMIQKQIRELENAHFCYCNDLETVIEVIDSMEDEYVVDELSAMIDGKFTHPKSRKYLRLIERNNDYCDAISRAKRKRIELEKKV